MTTEGATICRTRAAPIRGDNRILGVGLLDQGDCMRAGLLAAALAVASGCGMTGDDEDALRLLLYASPRVVPTDGEHIALIGVEAVDPGGTLDPSVPMCVR